LVKTEKLPANDGSETGSGNMQRANKITGRQAPAYYWQPMLATAEYEMTKLRHGDSNVAIGLRDAEVLPCSTSVPILRSVVDKLVGVKQHLGL